MSTLIENKQAKWRYSIVETLEAGIVLSGQEVKSLRAGQGDLRNAYITVQPLPAKGKRRIRLAAFLINAAIPPYAKAGRLPEYNPRQSRRLLLHRRELMKLIGTLKEAGLTMVPLKVYTLHRRVKILIGLASGKTAADKRETIRRREVDREIRRATLSRQ